MRLKLCVAFLMLVGATIPVVLSVSEPVSAAQTSYGVCAVYDQDGDCLSYVLLATVPGGTQVGDLDQLTCLSGDPICSIWRVVYAHPRPSHVEQVAAGSCITRTVAAGGQQAWELDTNCDGVPNSQQPPLTRGQRLCFATKGSPDDAALVNLTPVLAEGAGDGKLVSSDVANPPRASNVNFGPGTIDPNVAVTPIGADGKVCFVNSVHTEVHLVADHLGTIASSAYTPATASGAPDRRVDTRTGQGGDQIPPSGRRCFTVAGNPGDAAVVNLTPVLASGAGDGQLVSSDVGTPPTASNVNFRPGSVDPNVAIVKIGADGQVCYVNSVHASVHLVADHLGTIAGSAYTAATSSGAPDRRVDTRKVEMQGTGCLMPEDGETYWYDPCPPGAMGQPVNPSGRLCFTVSGNAGDAALVNLTPVLAEGAGDGQLVSSDVATAPKASNVNYRPGSVDPNVAIAPIGADGKVCYVNSTHTSVHLIADHLGTIAKSAYTSAMPSGAPDRRLDTRDPLYDCYYSTADDRWIKFFPDDADSGQVRSYLEADCAGEQFDYGGYVVAPTLEAAEALDCLNASRFSSFTEPQTPETLWNCGFAT